MNKKILAFTLVELVITITILAILGTITFLSYTTFTKSARESTRFTDIASISRTLEYFKAQYNYYPDPSDAVSITFSGSLAWKKGDFGENTRRVSTGLQTVPIDPFFGNRYPYSVTNSRQQYEIAFVTENPLAGKSLFYDSVYAESGWYTNSIGNFDEKIVSVLQGSELYILGIPTLITTSSALNIEDIILNHSFALNNSPNIPSAYNTLGVGNTQKYFIPGSIVGTVAPVLFQGDVKNISLDSYKIAFITNLISYYKDSNISNEIGFSDAFKKYSGNEVMYVDLFIKNKIIPQVAFTLSSDLINQGTEQDSGSGNTETGGENIQQYCISQEEADFLNKSFSDNGYSFSMSEFCKISQVEINEKSVFYNPDIKTDPEILTTLLTLLYRIPTLTELSLENPIMGFQLPEGISQLRDLSILRISGNEILFPPDIQELKNLSEFYIDILDISSFPREILDLKGLQYFSIRGNKDLFGELESFLFGVDSPMMCFQEDKQNICFEGEKSGIIFSLKETEKK